jgi:hypothetical protein
MVVLSAVFLGYESEWLKVLQGQEDAQTLIPKLQRLVSAMHADSKGRLAKPAVPAAVAEEAMQETTASWVDLGSSLVSFGARVAVVEDQLAIYRSVRSGPAMLLAHQSIISECVRLVYLVQRSKATARLQETLDHLAGQRLSWRYNSLAARVALLHGSSSSASKPTAVETIELSKARSALGFAYGFASAATQDVVAPDVVSEADSILATCLRPRSTITNSTVSSLDVSTSEVALSSLSSFLQSQAVVPLDSGTTRSQAKVIVFAVGVGISVITFVASVVIYIRHAAQTKRAVALVEAFGSPERSKEMIQAYRPILHYMQTNVRIPPAETEVEREFLFAARIIQQLRPLMPQALFGDLNAPHKKEPNGSWDITSQPIRVEMGLAFCHCHVLTITFSTENTIKATKNHVEQVLVEASQVLHVVTDEVNNSGGIVCGVAPDGRITCLWNATNVVESGAFVAVRTARAIDKRLTAIGILHDLNIATGPSIVANNKVGAHHKHVTYIGNAFEVGEKLLLLNESHSSRLVIDSETFKELPRDFQRTCKPIAVLRDKDESTVVAVAADAECAIKGDQWKQYNTAFTLYQNNMNSEALNEFKKYLACYPDDEAAQWLVQNVLEKSATKRSSVVLTNRPSSARTSSSRLR